MSLATAEKPHYNARQFKKLGDYPMKHCESDFCGKRLMPKVLASGQLESLGQFEARRGCNRQCGGQIRKQDHAKRKLGPAESLPTTEWLETPRASEPKQQTLKRLLKAALHHHDPDLLNAWPDSERKA